MIKRRTEQGLVLILVMVLISVMMVVGLALMSQTTSQYVLTTQSSKLTNATYVAEAGIEQSVHNLNSTTGFTGYATPQVFFNSASQGYGTYTTTITQAPGNAQAKVITSVGKIYHPRNHSKLLSSRTVQVTVVGTTSNGYSIMTGPGGLILSGSATVTNSSLYIGGTIKITGNSTIGTDAKPLGVNVANKACLSSDGTTYPVLCSTQPISMPDWTNSAIIGDTCATGQTQSKFPNNGNNTNKPQIRASSTLGGQGLIAGCTAPDASPPVFNRASIISSMTTSATVNTSNSNLYNCTSNGTYTWPVNVKITGNVNIAGSCTVTIPGNAYITGTLTIGGAAIVKIADSAGTTQPVIAVDGIINIGGSAAINTNASGTGAQFVSFASNSTACNLNGNTSGAGCTTITGKALQTTSTYTTVTVGGAVKVPGMTFDAYWGEVNIGGSGNVGAAAGQTINLSGAGTITFGTQLSSGVSTWTISSYQILYPSH